MNPYSAAYQDQENQLQYLNSRYFDPQIIRFIQWDSYDLINRYSYADGNPTMNEDPSGYLSSAIATGLDFLLPGLGDAINGQYKSAAIMFGGALGTGLAIGGAASLWNRLSAFSESDFGSAEPLLAHEDLPAASLFNPDSALFAENQREEVIPKRIIPQSSGDVIQDLYTKASANNFRITKNDFFTAFDNASRTKQFGLITYAPNEAAKICQWSSFLDIDKAKNINKKNLAMFKKIITKSIRPEDGLSYDEFGPWITTRPEIVPIEMWGSLHEGDSMFFHFDMKISYPSRYNLRFEDRRNNNFMTNVFFE